jgi:Uma2 family endonuclease
MNWFELCQDKRLADLPYKIELDEHGKIIMSPATKKHSKLQGAILRLLNQLLPQGDALPECAMHTTQGTRVADATWISEARWTSMDPDAVSCSVAPEICVEILSPANTIEEMLGTAEKPGKRELYFQAGALEFWVCDESGNLSFYTPGEQLPKSNLCPGFPSKV